MKRNKIFALALCLTAALALAIFCGCQKETTVYDNLNNLAKKQYSKIGITVTANDGTDTLSGTYALTEADGTVTVVYNYQQLATFEESNGELVAPENRIETKSGTIKLKDGKVTEGNADDLNISVGALNLSGLNFKEDYFTSIISGDGEFSAIVSDPNSFMGASTSCKEMNVSVKYSESALESLKIVYNENGVAVTLQYTFA